MKQKLSTALYVILAVLMLLDFYLIFNVGNPDSLLRFLITTTDYDIAITIGVSVVIAFFSFYVFRTRKEHPVVMMLEANKAHINKMRKQGNSTLQIAESFLQELNPHPRSLEKTRNLVVKTLEEMEK